MKTFEDELNQMSKPEVGYLRHENLLAKSISRVQDKSRVSLWWISIPVYMLSAFIMKGFYTHNFSIASSLHEIFSMNGYLRGLVFFALPAILIVANLTSIRQLMFLYGSSEKTALYKLIYSEALVVFLSLIVMLVFVYEWFTA